MSLGRNKINKELIPMPSISLSDEAQSQLRLIIDNDITLSGKYLRITISGKGCSGFKYSIGFSDIHEDDIEAKTSNSKNSIIVLIDAFTAFYLQNALIDYKHGTQNDDDGFIVINNNHDQYKGKFWLENPTDTPPLVK